MFNKNFNNLLSMLFAANNGMDNYYCVTGEKAILFSIEMH